MTSAENINVLAPEGALIEMNRASREAKAKRTARGFIQLAAEAN